MLFRNWLVMFASAMFVLPSVGGLTTEPAPGEARTLAEEVLAEMWIVSREYNEDGQLEHLTGIEPSNPFLWYTKSWTHKPNHGGGGGPPGGDPPGGTDCTSTKYSEAGWFWTSAYSATASSYASQMNTAGNTWDDATGANIFGGISSGSSATAGDQDFVNQIDWVSLGASTTIAVTTTWYYRSTGEAVESDGQYNTYYSWSTSGAQGSMDVLNIGVHEVGHTFGLDHPRGGGISCLTMYAYAGEGETQKRTLGDGDILGIQAIYGA